MKDFNSNATNNDEWLTPPYIIKELGEFDLDPCCPHPDKRPWDTAWNHYHKEIDGLSQSWGGRVWCNPPYGRETFKWLEKLYDHGNGIALIFARTETIGFHEQIWNKAHAVFFFKGRLKFYRVDGSEGDTCNAPSCLVAYGNANAESLELCKLKGKYIQLKKEINYEHGEITKIS